MNDKKVERLYSREVTTHSLVNWLTDNLDKFAELYVVAKDKDGNFVEAVYGDAQGAAFSALILQQKAIETL